jgi:glycosyltransferase involved in cell wall biosynthesis
MKDVSVLIPTCNRAPALDLTLASLATQDHLPFEVIVVDDGSTDETLEVIERHRATLPLIYAKQANRGRAAARNHALQLASGGVCVYCDDDRIAAPGFLTAHARRSAQGDAHFVIGAQRGIIAHFDRRLCLPVRSLSNVIPLLHEGQLVTTDDVRNRFEEVTAALGVSEPWWDDFVQEVLAQFALPTFRLPWILGTTANLSAPRALLAEIGGLDESFVGWGLEDFDLCYRLHRRGARPVIADDAINFHQLHWSAEGATERRLQWQRNLIRFVEKESSDEVALFAEHFTRAGDPDLATLQSTLKGIDDESDATTAALRAACLDLVQGRTFDFRAMGGLPAVRW